METTNFWRPTKAAAERLGQLGIKPVRREAPNANMFFGGNFLPDEFIIIDSGTPGQWELIGLRTEPAGLIMEAAAEIAAERLHLRPGGGSPDGREAHDDQVAIDAMRRCGCSKISHKGEILLWWHHEMFGLARRAALHVALLHR